MLYFSSFYIIMYLFTELRTYLNNCLQRESIDVAVAHMLEQYWNFLQQYFYSIGQHFL